MPFPLLRGGLAAALLTVSAAGSLPAAPASPPTVQTHRDIAYVQNGDSKQRLDLYLPVGKTGFPVLVFLHGGMWSTGDRSQYGELGRRFAREGIGVVVPSYRLAPTHPHPAQIEDAAAAFAWVSRSIGPYGGDASRLYVGGHSAGGHLASLLALNGSHLRRFGLAPQSIKGVLAISGVYVVMGFDRLAGIFGADPQVWREASPLQFVHRDAPPFLILYAQNDLLTLPQQAQAMHQALVGAGVSSELIPVLGENHVSILLSLARENDPGMRRILQFLA